MKPNSLAHIRFRRRFLGVTFAYLASIALCTWLIPDDAPPTAFNIALALLPGLCVIGWIWTMGSFLFELEDEYLRMLEIRKFLIATGWALSITSAWGILELFTTVPHVQLFFVFPLWCIGLMVGSIANHILERGPSEEAAQ